MIIRLDRKPATASQPPSCSWYSPLTFQSSTRIQIEPDSEPNAMMKLEVTQHFAFISTPSPSKDTLSPLIIRQSSTLSMISPKVCRKGGTQYPPGTSAPSYFQGTYTQ